MDGEEEDGQKEESIEKGGRKDPEGIELGYSSLLTGLFHIKFTEGKLPTYSAEPPPSWWSLLSYRNS